MSGPSGLLRAATASGAALSMVAALVSLTNAVRLPRPARPQSELTDSVVVCIPARDEAFRLPALLADLNAQTHCPSLRVVVLDDDSSDDTFEIARRATSSDPRFLVERNRSDPPEGWTGKAAACHRLAERALAYDADLIVFVDADVRLAPAALASAATAMASMNAALLCPWPEQIAVGAAEQLIQPLLGFSWMTTLPIRLANRSTRPSTVVSCGQFMMFDAHAYREIGGHASVAGSLTEDLDIARALRRHGRRTVLVSGAGLVRCRMYDDWPSLRDGYTRWLWTAFGGAPGSLSVSSALALVYVLPPVAAVFSTGVTQRYGCIGYAAAVTARMLCARTESGRGVGSIRSAAGSAAHPISVLVYLALTLESVRRHRRGVSTWKNRPI
ncbi:glycosyltransferase family 2 protein [Rhodococcus sp. G-MC3]|uniref:glycosyltransferase n=1 Tax=Rhodococcus sp. G-MC3 TaxID=3046209 RepID=UPI0024BB490B|nr:glycosyltransferase family 2 protein [Rhodococcus sp. G-MC3]MDJ0393074.1 glycosyltransferase family 2 protein [Rhodococcus sp. G-MC3]